MLLLYLLCALSGLIHAAYFPFETHQLSPSETENYPLVAFGNLTSPFSSPFPNNTTSEKCKISPGDSTWPSPAEWQRFNDTLGGALIKGSPPARVCYREWENREECENVRGKYYDSKWRIDDAVMVVNEWLDGDSCPLPDLEGNGTVVSKRGGGCHVDAYPAYVVNVTTVRRSLSIWTHHLTSFSLLPTFTTSSQSYHGPALHIAAGLQKSTLQSFAEASNITLVLPGAPTVGVVGGWMQGGGHGHFTSLYGLGADQVLEVNLVMADGKFVTVSEREGRDVFWAVRGGGGSTYGIITSAIIKVYPPISIGKADIAFTTSTSTSQNSTIPSISTPQFWTGIRTYLKFTPRICDNGGIGQDYIIPSSKGSLTFTLTLSMPGMSTAQTNAFASTFYDALNAAGLNIPNPYAVNTTTNTSELEKAKAMSRVGEMLAREARATYPSRGPGAKNIRLASRLFPRVNVVDEVLLDGIVKAIRGFVEEGGYTFHGTVHCPTLDVAGFPDNAVLPAYRKAVIHAQGWDSAPAIGPVDEQIKRYSRFAKYFQKWRDITPDSGSYMGEADPAEPNWQQSFYGENYERLLSVKRAVDPWDLFWARTAVGSEGWSVDVPGGHGWPSQNGRLCRV